MFLVVIMDPVSGKIWGKIREKFGAYQLMSPCGVAFNEKGQLCIADTCVFLPRLLLSQLDPYTRKEHACLQQPMH